MFVRYQLPVLILVLVLVVEKTLQTISGGFVPSLNVTVNQWNSKSIKLQIQICFEILILYRKNSISRLLSWWITTGLLAIG